MGWHISCFIRHILKPRVADVFCELVDYGRSQGLEWWTSAQIHQWEVARRDIAGDFASADTFRLRAPKPLHEVSLLVLNPRQTPGSITVNGQAAISQRWRVYGFDFDCLSLDLTGDVHVRIA
jgi:hypothetical protein